MIKHIKRWNKWRKSNMNSKLHKFLVLIGIIESPTMAYVLLDSEEEAIHKAFMDGFNEGMNGGNSNG